jgi:dihydropteroate synthase
MLLRLAQLPLPPFATSQSDAHSDARTWLLPVGMTSFCEGSREGINTAGAKTVMSLAGGDIGFTHFDVINKIDGQMTVTRIAAERLMDEAAAGGVDAETRAEQAIERITRRRPDFVGLTPSCSDGRPHIMGILNTTLDSFSDGGDYAAAEAALARGEKMIKEGATILDVGGESTRPGATPVDFDEECRRILPVITPLAEAGHVVSADTRHTNVMEAALAAGATIINDVGGLRDDGAAELVAHHEAPSIIMHMQGVPGNMQENPKYAYAPTDIYDWLAARIEAALAAGALSSHLAVDPGFGFGKSPEHNMMIMANIALFHGLGVPIVLGVSRKSTIAHFARGEAAKDRLAGSVALAALGFQQGVQIFRVHDVAATAQALGNAAAFAQARA